MASIAVQGSRIPGYFLLRESAVTLDLIGPAEVLRYANRNAENNQHAAYFDLHCISAENTVATSLGLSLGGFASLPDALPANAI